MNPPILNLTPEKRKRARQLIAHTLGVEFEKVPEFFELEWKSLGIDSLDMVELMMELEEDLELGED